MENEGYISIYKHLTFFRLFPNNKDHRFDFYKNLDFQEEITEIVRIKYANFYRLKFSLYDELLSYLLSSYAYSNPIRVINRLSCDGRDYIFNNGEWFSNLFKLLKNYKYKYGLSYEITHEIYPLIHARRTNCNMIEERYVQYLLQRYSSYSNKELFSKSLVGITAKRLTNFLFNNPDVIESKKIKLYLWEYKLLIGMDTTDKSFTHKVCMDTLFRVLRSLGIDATFKDEARSPIQYLSCKRLINLYKQGYQYHIQEPEDKNLFDDEIIRKYKLKKVKYNYLRLFSSKEI